jgi:hypothetical protein
MVTKSLLLLVLSAVVAAALSTTAANAAVQRKASGRAGTSSEATRRLAPPNVLNLASATGQMRDTILHSPLSALKARSGAAPAGFWGGVYTAPDGETVTIYTSNSYLVDDAVSQSWAGFFTWLLHGSELSRLTVFMAPLAEVQAFCGANALGCYSPASEAMVVPGDQSYGVNMEQIVAHEYGHHIAANRSNPPWQAGDWGPKNWATAANVCSRQAAGTAFPGDETANYNLNPGEAWAETYRFAMVQQEERATAAILPSVADWATNQLPWNSDQSFYPTDAALSAVQADVQSPWTTSTNIPWMLRFKKHKNFAATRSISTPLDGTLTVTLFTPGVTLYLVDQSSGAVLASSSASFSYTVCGSRYLTLRATGRGPALLRVSVSAS